MKKDLKVTLVQPDVFWLDRDPNRCNIAFMLKDVGETDLIILPEMFNTGFSMEPARWSETEDGATLTWMKNVAKIKNAAVTGSMIIEEDGNFYNRLFFVHPNGEYQTYDKHHLFTLAEEDKHYSAGNEILIVDYLGWKIKPLVCYDLRFPVWARNTEGYDLLLYVANWPSPRKFAWQQLLIARAIENQCYVAGVNRVGTDGNGFEFSGDSAVLNPLGEEMASIANEEAISTVTLSKDKLHEVRNKLKFLADKDNFELAH